ncbi:peptidase M23 family [Thermodesulfobium acidiphilum]|uniref:Peptidase M23 family n=1 Tax=Thermodesulfobium acidiphilum TaxID=1794699 RepID=A0A2R4VZ43_THEAF|nr:M23 family metallopeptidase [Thermodesulfobium acidiphilum]AWB09821.1 peptidase M23 family [Thermodesulfobium acidiphilum]
MGNFFKKFKLGSIKEFLTKYKKEIYYFFPIIPLIVGGLIITSSVNLKPKISNFSNLPVQKVSKGDVKKVESEPKLQIQEYTVQPGDTLESIAQKFSINYQTIKLLNDIRDEGYLKVGQKLKIPNMNGVIYTVQPGDTLGEICDIYGVSQERILKSNNIPNPQELQIGQDIFIPGLDVVSEVANKWTSNNSNNGYERIALAYRGRGFPGDFIWPVDGPITSGFGWRIHPIFGTPEFHTGIDIGVPYGTPVRAADRGVVTYAGWEHGYGEIVTINHGDGISTSYSHNSSIVVSVGQRVSQGQVIAYAGSTGWSTGPHVLFEIKVDGRYVNPLNYLPR